MDIDWKKIATAIVQAALNANSILMPPAGLSDAEMDAYRVMFDEQVAQCGGSFNNIKQAIADGKEKSDGIS